MPNVEGHYLTGLSSWRRLAAATWRLPDDASMYAQIDIDLTATRALLPRASTHYGTRLTVTHLVIKALGDTLRAHPECNLLVRRGRLYQRDHVCMSVAVAIPPENADQEMKADLTEVVLRDVDQMDLGAIATAMQRGARAVRANEDKDFAKAKGIMNALPPRGLNWLLRFLGWLQFDWNISLGALGLPRDPFGGAMITNVGSFGITVAYPPLVPFMRIPIILCVGEAQDKAVVVDGQIVVRPILPIFATIDHRVIDGYQGGRMIKTFKGILENPALLLPQK